ncbi:MAG: EamA family transporter [Treponema sp.]|nr:EamA family transporter [Treponema sp.]
MMNTRCAFALMYAAFFVYSTSSVFSKLASMQDFLSPLYFLCFSMVMFSMAAYAFLWQIVLKSVPLSVAMANKPIALIFAILWSVVLFHESIEIKTVVGSALVLCGTFITRARW